MLKRINGKFYRLEKATEAEYIEYHKNGTWKVHKACPRCKKNNVMSNHDFQGKDGCFVCSNCESLIEYGEIL